MTSAPLGPTSTPASSPRLGRALFFIHQQASVITDHVVRAQLGQLIAAGEAMSYAVTLKDHALLTGAMAVQFAAHAGIAEQRLYTEVLPKLKAADLIDYKLDLATARVASIEEFVGLSGRVIDQAMKVTEKYHPTDVEWAVLHCTELASWAPLTVDQHAEQLHGRGYTDEVVKEAMKLTYAAGVNQRVRSADLGEYVVYNPNVWSAQHISIAAFLKSLPPAERDSLLGLCEQAADRPGMVLSSYGGFQTGMLSSARKVGLVQAATVKSSATGGHQTYLFSPLLESEDDKLQTTEVLHKRKLFVAHILYGHEKAIAERGRIYDPRVLVQALLNRGQVGPASNIASDYHLLEANGIVAVSPASSAPGRAYLQLVKREIVEGGLGWIKASYGGGDGSAADLGSLQPPSNWTSPEADRTNLPDSGATNEIAESAVLRLREARKAAQSATRRDTP
ncbi:hypothetical protein CH249_01320 [Rhodococcus sp. 05-2255-3B1]|uniref:hypothetical protein n=1 Tax=unclassified Rhodococcus (in: high G+C Gram-positive bacteria) TaxID=192944 RepID=UPI000B9AD5C1|nr:MULTISPECIES: hypothetical protein [unclassified Rhodococcus (in: high G+C Gram-positive bacteria)]OZE13462.1 hypothetical protein CH250_06045 [Rhodococcus sp. 05-2255-3C]OZE15923.1 hypothetical protein CH249_01320 [Rhodococcus sp. 05-2255-3B1]OZE18962.1 hypothetical protein CH255_13345 [Rhodococcus sp. 05-2255-2A2]